MKVLNLYSGLGGNRKLWEDVDVTAVEIEPDIAQFYKDHFPNDNVIVGDAHQYLLDHYKEFDFIWTSPPCPTHSRSRFWNSKGGGTDVKYPDMKLYEEIILLDKYADCKWIVENVTPYYSPLIPPESKIGRHVFWSNFKIGTPDIIKKTEITDGKRSEWEEFHGFSLDGYRFNTRTDKILRNCVYPPIGKHIFDRARGIFQYNNTKQTALF